jgi:DNA polymerase III delta prime subunit
MLPHHAYYIEGLLAEFDTYKAALRPLWANTFERFGIDEARELVKLASFKNYTEAIFLVGAASITSEAQQALLKLLEEPPTGTVFVLLVPHGSLLPTVRSRMLPYPTVHIKEASSLNNVAKTFLHSGGKERSDMIAILLKNEEGVKERVRSFMYALEALLAPTLRTNAQAREGIEDIALMRGYLGDRSPSLKMLLEHLALSLPRI